jgi:hypothetical protein
MKNILTYIVLPIIIVLLGYLIYRSVQEPVEFNKAKEFREKITIERLKDIRTLEVAYKTKYGKYTASFDTLLDFYNNGVITLIKQIGSLDDSLAVAQKRVYRDSVKLAVKDTLLKRNGFIIDSLQYIPFSGKQKFEMKAIIGKVSGVDVPLFEACAPYDILLAGLKRQFVVNLNYERTSSDKYPGLRVGSVDAPNNNAGNWE